MVEDEYVYVKLNKAGKKLYIRIPKPYYKQNDLVVDTEPLKDIKKNHDDISNKLLVSYLDEKKVELTIVYWEKSPQTTKRDDFLRFLRNFANDQGYKKEKGKKPFDSSTNDNNITTNKKEKETPDSLQIIRWIKTGKKLCRVELQDGKQAMIPYSIKEYFDDIGSLRIPIKNLRWNDKKGYYDYDDEP